MRASPVGHLGFVQTRRNSDRDVGCVLWEATCAIAHVDFVDNAALVVVSELGVVVETCGLHRRNAATSALLARSHECFRVR